MSDESKPRWRWGRWLGAGAAVAVLLAVMAYAIHDQSVRGGLAGLERELDASDPGWRMADILRDRPPVAEDENSVPRFIAVAATLPPRWPGVNEEKILAGIPPNALLNADQQAALNALLAGVPREKARDLIRFPRGRFEMRAVRPGIWRAEPVTDQMWAVPTALNLDSWGLALEGRTDDALDSARAVLSIGRSLADDPLPVARALRAASRYRGFTAVERALALGEASDAALAKLAGDPGPVAWTHGLRGERAWWHDMMSAVGRGDVEASEVAREFNMSVPAAWEYVGPVLRREWTRREHLYLLRLMTRMVEVSRLPPADQFAENEEIERKLQHPTGMFSKLAWAVLRGSLAQGRAALATGATFRVTIAVERYRLKHKRWPAKLDDVVPAFLDAVPEDPMDGKPLRYKKTPDGVVVYSIGNDRTDDGGDVAAPYKDVGFRLWDVDKRGVKP